jgi:heme exporter protein C
MPTLVLWLLYMAYLILRASLPEGDRRSRICAVFGIIGFIDVPIVWMSIRWWRSIHPVVITSEGANLHPLMFQSLILAVFACLGLLTVLVLLRGSIRLNHLIVQELAQKVLDRRSV